MVSACGFASNWQAPEAMRAPKPRLALLVLLLLQLPLTGIAAGEAPPSAPPANAPDPADRTAKIYREMSKFPRNGDKDRSISFMVTFFEKPGKEIKGKLSKIGIRRDGRVSDDKNDVWEGFAEIGEVLVIEEEIFRSKGVIRA